MYPCRGCLGVALLCSFSLMESLFLHVLWTSPSWGRRNQGIQTSKVWNLSLACSDPSWSSVGSWDSFIALVAGLAPIVNCVWTCHHLYLMFRIVIFGVHLNSMWSYAITAWSCGSYFLFDSASPTILPRPQEGEEFVSSKRRLQSVCGCRSHRSLLHRRCSCFDWSMVCKAGNLQRAVSDFQKSLPSTLNYYVKGL